MWLFYIFIIQIQDFLFFQTQACFFIQVYPPLCDSNCLALADKVQSFETRLFYMITWMFYEVFLGYVPIPEIIKELDLADKKSFWIEIFEKLQLLFRILINTFCSVALKNKYFLIYKFLLESTAFRIMFKLPIGRNNIVAAKIIVSENKLLLLSGGAIVQGCRDQMYYQSSPLPIKCILHDINWAMSCSANMFPISRHTLPPCSGRWADVYCTDPVHIGFQDQAELRATFDGGHQFSSRKGPLRKQHNNSELASRW